MSTATIDLASAEPRGMDETLGGYVPRPRMIDKARAKQAGTLGHFVHPCPVDRTLLARMRIEYGMFKRIIQSTRTDAEALAALREVEGIASPAKVRVTLGPGASRAAHCHPYDEVVLIKAGAGVAHTAALG